jgi:hypothetical protein
MCARRRSVNKSTSAITLLLVGAFVAACDSDERHRAFYGSKEACLKDWGTESSCQQSQGPNGAFVYYGPWYNRSSPFWGHGSGAAAGIVAQGGRSATSASEGAHFGGFGESASGHGGTGA